QSPLVPPDKLDAPWTPILKERPLKIELRHDSPRRSGRCGENPQAVIRGTLVVPFGRQIALVEEVAARDREGSADAHEDPLEGLVSVPGVGLGGNGALLVRRERLGWLPVVVAEPGLRARAGEAAV